MRDPDQLLRAADVRGDPHRDQHFLVDDRVLDRLPAYLDDGPAREHILEIGAGTGALTDRLLNIADHVTAVEQDPELVSFLESEFADAIAEGRLTVIAGDALEIELPEFTGSVSNLPYSISSEVLFRLLPRRQPLVVTVQREFAERMVAEPGTANYGRLSVSAGHYADVELVEPVPPEAFTPPPAVESAIVRTRPRPPDDRINDPEFFLRFVKAVFTQRRKTMRNAIRNTAHISELSDPDAVVDAADPELLGKRAGNLTPEQFAMLASLADEVGR